MAPLSPYFSMTRCNEVRGGLSSLLLRKPATRYASFLKPCYLKEELPSPLSQKISLCQSHTPSASFSTYAGADEEPTNIRATKEAVDTESSGSETESSMADAFHISSRTAFGITAMIVLVALTFPLVMKSVSQTVGMKMKVLSYLTVLSGFYMAWNIGANDVANAMGTSVGSGALTLRQAVLTAAVLEFSGAFLMGTHVTNTMQKGILVASVFQGKESLMFAGLLSSLAAAGTWLQVASFYGWPVSTTHCIVGAMVGFGLVYGGVNAVFWSSLARVSSSWVISPIMGAAASFIVYKCIRRVSSSYMRNYNLFVPTCPTNNVARSQGFH